MSYKAIYAYAWDLAEVGLASAAARFRGLGLDTVTIAGSYHAGKFLRPHGRTGKVYFPEDGTVYFRPAERLYGAIKPVVSRVAREHDVLRELCESGAIGVNVWLVLLHNTKLGEAHPESCVMNAFGDRYVYNLCPAAPAARDYALGLCQDVASNYPVRGLSLETPGFLPYAHGFHHEFALLRSNPWLENLLGLCFCDHCVARVEASGVEARRLKSQVAADIDAYLASDIDFPPDMAEAFWKADVVADGDLRRYLDFRNAVVTSLVTQIRDVVRPDAHVAVIPSVARPTGGAWYEGSDLKALGNATGTIEACFYEPTPMRVKADLFDIRRRVGSDVRLRGILRPAYPDLATEGDFLAAVDALSAGGVDELAFYNYGHLRRANLAWIGTALGGSR
jgi:hypothetical protein